MLKFIIIATLTQLVLSLISSYIGNKIIPIPSNFNGNAINTTSFYTSFVTLISVEIFGPFFETLIFQCGVISICLVVSKAETKKIKVISIICSSLLFGFAHYLTIQDYGILWSTLYAFKTGISGIIFSYTYVLYYSKTKKNTDAIVSTFLVHVSNNILSIIMSVI